MRAILNLIMENILLWFLYDIAYMMQAISYPGDYNDPTSDYEQRFMKYWSFEIEWIWSIRWTSKSDIPRNF